MNETYDFIVAGGGASGLLAAGRGAELGLRVLVLEKMNKPAIKLSISGKGRCNITNSAPLSDFMKRIKPDGRFLRQAFNRFFNSHTVEFFESRGVSVRLERGGRYFPESQKAADIVKALLGYCKTHGAKIQTCSRVLEITTDEGSSVSGVLFQSRLPDKREHIRCQNILLATGGNCYHSTGSTGDGYRIATDAGHSVTGIFGAQVPVDLNFKYLSKLCGLHLKNVSLTLWTADRKVAGYFGEMNFTKTGVSGPVVLKISRKVSEYLSQGQKLWFEIDLKPAVDAGVLDNRLVKLVKEYGKKSVLRLLKEFLPKQLIDTCSEINGINRESRAIDLGAQTRKKLRNWMKGFRLEIDSVRPIDEAIVTAGGVTLGEVNPRTMESRILNGLFFSGEILDVDADTGGFNLQVAFSTGILAAEAVCNKLRLQGNHE